MHVRLEPKPHEFIYLDRMFFSRRLEVRVDTFWVPRGVWVECDQELLSGMKSVIQVAKKAGDTDKVDRVSLLREQCSRYCRD